jgi:hypothetical protein
LSNIFEPLQGWPIHLIDDIEFNTICVYGPTQTIRYKLDVLSVKFPNQIKLVNPAIDKSGNKKPGFIMMLLAVGYRITKIDDELSVIPA